MEPRKFSIPELKELASKPDTDQDVQQFKKAFMEDKAYQKAVMDIVMKPASQTSPEDISIVKKFIKRVNPDAEGSYLRNVFTTAQEAYKKEQEDQYKKGEKTIAGEFYKKISQATNEDERQVARDEMKTSIQGLDREFPHRKKN